MFACSGAVDQVDEVGDVGEHAGHGRGSLSVAGRAWVRQATGSLEDRGHDPVHHRQVGRVSEVGVECATTACKVTG
ncbi:hypothetical protein OG216_00705 [Streptomycetaceae bacterium NBC_01309]